MKKIVSIILMIALLSLPLLSLAVNLSDISGHWAESYIVDLASKNVINGYEDGTFRPDGILTYGEFFKLIVTASLKISDYNTIVTNYSHWSGPYAQILANYGIISETLVTDETLAMPIPRIEVVRVLGECDIKIRENAQLSANIEFTDIDSISSKEKTLLRHAVGCGIINGDPEGTFRPNDSLKRSEAAKIIYLYSEM